MIASCTVFVYLYSKEAHDAKRHADVRAYTANLVLATNNHSVQERRDNMQKTLGSKGCFEFKSAIPDAIKDTKSIPISRMHPRLNGRTIRLTFYSDKV